MPGSNPTEGRGRWTTRRTAIVAATVTLVVAVGAGVGALALRRHPGGADASAPPQVTTTKVARADLSDTRSLNGTLGFGPERMVKGAGEGIVTRLPKVGDTVARGKPLYHVDDRPVPVLFGGTPLFRTLDKPGLVGSDVRLVSDNLRALGFHTGSQPSRGKDGTRIGAGQALLTASLVAAIKKWQQSIGLEPTGTIGVGQVAVLTGPARVSAVKALPGDAVAGELLAVTEKVKLVTVPVAATEVGTITVGAAVVVALPDNSQIPGKVASVSQTVSGGGSDGGGDQGKPPMVEVLVAPTRTADVAKIDAAAVQVRFTTAVHENVLAVPVGALVALSEGGHALQLPGGGLVAVETGMFARGLVEVSGTGVTEGLDVVTAS
ncbi:efflux RND transporter periplasmic adaptor subunit [Micromonospora sp. WMMC250]|uniref:efflux RND transporter periplasmic adaptor subunit n=1 Tax=Micromonospora sp. WMMC250 TaxID=3014781 RepID=UPI0022B61E49|nr:efflux RND transporter periplasmic adaptor subunit [Micromonospora sp. WMMC250]MCZ7376293.1 efflux RND transporter periplasmic adaptor subunit [Micromonospora sp. WMMC250]